MLKIGLCGAGGSGKGTLAKALADEKTLMMLDSPVQQIGKLMFPNSENYKDIQVGDTNNRLFFQYSAVSSQIAMENLVSKMAIRGYVAERSLFDYLAYMARYSFRDEFDSYEKYVLSAYYKNPYDIIFYISADDFTPDDINTSGGWKEREPNERDWTGRWLNNYLGEIAEATDTAIASISGDTSERLKQINFFIDKYITKDKISNPLFGYI